VSNYSTSPSDHLVNDGVEHSVQCKIVEHVQDHKQQEIRKRFAADQDIVEQELEEHVHHWEDVLHITYVELGSVDESERPVDNCPVEAGNEELDREQDMEEMAELMSRLLVQLCHN